MTVYVRTAKGQQAAYEERSALPRKLKSLLRVVDGTSQLETYVQNLSAFGDIRNVLRSLEIAGLLQQTGGAGALAPAQMPGSASPVAAASPGTSYLRKLQDGLLQRTAASLGNQAQTVAQATALSAYHDTEAEAEQAHEDDANSEEALLLAVDEMSSFVLQYTPEHAMAVLEELEGLRTFEQLSVVFGAYAQMMRPLGAKAGPHLEHI
ncbi:MAG: hypothetical protein JWQ72_3284, partial [Polaromonas sp.]|nr:hypothetical protein [Polaromonas sp.]